MGESSDGLVRGGISQSAYQWVNALSAGSREVGKLLATSVCRGQSGVVSDYEESRVAAAGSVLYAMGYCSARSAENELIPPIDEVLILETALTATLGDLESLSDKISPSAALRKIVSERAAAQKELKEAFALLEKEFSCQSLAMRSMLRSAAS